MLKTKIFALGVLQTNSYLLHTQNEALIIDPGGEPEKLIRYLKDNSLNLQIILNTHLHFDHIQGNSGLAEEFGAGILAPEADRFLMDTEVGAGGFMDFPETPAFEFKDLGEGIHSFAGHEYHVLATPGHTPGSLSFYFPELMAVFVGDLIFHRSVGRTDFPGGDMDVLIKSVRDKIFTLPEETMIYSGHGPQSRVLEEKLHNPFFQEKKFI